MHVFEFVLGIILIVTIGKLIERQISAGKASRRSDERKEKAAQASESEYLDKIRTLEERVEVLERIITDRRYELREKFRDLE